MLKHKYLKDKTNFGFFNNVNNLFNNNLWLQYNDFQKPIFNKFKLMNKSSLANNYKRRNLSFKKGIGSFLYSSKGEKYLDFVQGIAVNSLRTRKPIFVWKIKRSSQKTLACI